MPNIYNRHLRAQRWQRAQFLPLLLDSVRSVSKAEEKPMAGATPLTATNPLLNSVRSRSAPRKSSTYTCASPEQEESPCAPATGADQNQMAGVFVSLIDQIDRLNNLLSKFDTGQLPRQSPSSKTPITREHAARAKVLYAEKMLICEIAKAIGVSRTAASLLVHDKYPFSTTQRTPC